RPDPAGSARPGRMRIGLTRLAIAFVLGLCAWSADAQQPTKVPRVGILSDESPVLGAKSFEPFALGLRALGWTEGQNITIERRYAAGDNAALSNLAGELVRLHPDVIFAIGTPAALAAKNATATIPIVLPGAPIPSASGSFRRYPDPGGNL